MNTTARRLGACVVLALILGSHAPSPRAQSIPAVDPKITYILPHWPGFIPATHAEVATETAALRSKLGDEGIRVKLGFTTYIPVDVSPVDPTDPVAIRRQLDQAVGIMDDAIDKARQSGIVICLSFLTSIRGRTDPQQEAAQTADVRTVQWHSDNTIAPGWITFSRYARKQKAFEEAVIRELGRQLAARMVQYPETLVAATGDGEMELAYDETVIVDPSYTESTSLLADYSPFAIAEFRDWLRQGGLYAPSQSFAAESYSFSGRYVGDATPAQDSNGDGHFFNGDFGTSFTSWDLKHFDWSLAAGPDADPAVIPQVVFDGAGFNRLPAEKPGGFDAPRARNPSNPFWAVWELFRQTMVHRHNVEFAKWVTTSIDPMSGARVPADRWFSDQIVADHLFTNVVINPGNLEGFQQAPTFRLDTSASPHWTADIRPYGSFGITAFNLNVGPVPGQPGDVYYRTLASVAPAITARKVRWGIFEWSPSVPDSGDSTIYDLEMALVERHRPAILSPFVWEKVYTSRPGLGPQFEVALKNYITRRNNVPLTLNRTKVYASTSTDGATRSAPQIVRVSGEPGETPAWNASSAAGFVDIVKSADGRSFTVQLQPQAYAAGVQSATVLVQPTTPGYVAAILTVQVTATAPAATLPPLGVIDTPADLQVVTGEVGVTGWAVDDVGVRSVDIFRSPLAGEPTQPNGLVFLGTATPVEGARPDVEAIYGTVPASNQAGWGYQLLSNFLPNGGTGIYTIHAIATDMEGKTFRLGSRRVDARNADAKTPFGTIDTPAQGETISGAAYVNFGWALTRNGCIPIDGSTIDVYIDNVVVGHPVYNNPRSDISGLFPGLCNTEGAVGYFYIDTTRLTNGVHTIAWVARDTGGGATGMGSRYFTVANP